MESGTIAPDRQDHARAVEVLARRLTPDDVRHVLEEVDGKPRNGRQIQWIVAETENSLGVLRTKLPDSDLAAFLVDLSGFDLLSCRELRYRLALRSTPTELDILCEILDHVPSEPARRAKALAATNWHPGKRWARQFASVLGFPPGFAGIAGTPQPPTVEEVEPHLPLPPLEDFQTDLHQQLVETLQAPPGGNRGILTLPTGAGKTRTVVEGVVEWWTKVHGASGVILWIAQSEELCEQAIQAFRQVWIDRGIRPGAARTPLRLFRFWGADRPVPVGDGVVVASIQKLHAIYRESDSEARKADLQRLGGALAAVIVDEAHRALAPSYGEVLADLGISFKEKLGTRVPVIGMTATPYRSNEEEISQLVARFHGRLLRPRNLPAEDPIAALRTRGVLSRPVHRILDAGSERFELTPAQREYVTRWKDLPPDLLSTIGGKKQRNRRLLESLLTLDPGWPALFFGCSVEHAIAMAVLLRRAGRTAAVVTAQTRIATRRHLIEEFRTGRVSVLCNHGVLTTGFDAPRVRAIVLGRPTTSPVLYEQMIGRGMRGPRFGGTEECAVVDVVDNIVFEGQMAYTRYEGYWTTRVT